MGKIRSRVIGLEEVEKEQKEEQKKRSEEKKAEKKEKVEKKEKTEEVKEVVEVKEEKKTKKAEKKSKKKEEIVEEKVKKELGKRHMHNKKLTDGKKAMTPSDAVVFLKTMKKAAFDESVELHFNVIETGLKGEIELPHSTGKTVRVAIVDDALLDKLENGVIEFDVLITHPSFMPKLAKFAKTLGPKGLMPNPKAGTVSPKPEEVAKKYSKGLLRWKTEPKFPMIHQIVGKVSHADKDLSENMIAFIKSVGKSNIKSAFAKTTMSPAIQIDMEKLA